MDRSDFFGKLLDKNGLLNEQILWLVGTRKDPACLDDTILAYFRVLEEHQTEVICCFRINKTRQELVFCQPIIDYEDNVIFDTDLFETREGAFVIKVQFHDFVQFLSAENGQELHLEHHKRTDVVGKQTHSWYQVSLQNNTRHWSTISNVRGKILLYHDNQEPPQQIGIAFQSKVGTHPEFFDLICKHHTYLSKWDVFCIYESIHVSIVHVDRQQILISYNSAEPEAFLQALAQKNPKRLRILRHVFLLHTCKTERHSVCIFSNLNETSKVIGELLLVWIDKNTGKSRELVVEDLQHESRMMEMKVNPTTLNVYFWLTKAVVVRFHDTNVRYDENNYHLAVKSGLSCFLQTNLVAMCWSYVCSPLALEPIDSFACLGFRNEQPIDLFGLDDFSDSAKYLKILFM